MNNQNQILLQKINISKKKCPKKIVYDKDNYFKQIHNFIVSYNNNLIHF
jgi:hypothetical protein